MEFGPGKKEQDGRTVWLSECGSYRIIHQSHFGMDDYHAAVKCFGFDGRTMWAHAFRRGKYRTWNAAKLACERNERVWHRFIKLSHARGRRDMKLKALRDKTPTILANLPHWVAAEADHSLVPILYKSCREDFLKSLSDHTKA